MTYNTRIQQIEAWLDHCLDTHQACKWDDPSPPLPTRVLQLDLGDGSDDVRLVDGRDREGKYAALTYCWGPNPDAIFKTTSNNLGPNQSRIGLAKLNLLFREVIKMLRSLGVAYLWIDALCIIQDSLNDWENEASKMASIYSNAYLTMSASESTSPDDFQIPQYPDTEPDECLHPWDGLGHVVDHGALSKRGWCLQERCLSRRIVHLGSSQIHWECPGATYDEHFKKLHRAHPVLLAHQRIMLGPRGFLNDDLLGMGRHPYRLWYAILGNYGKRSLSFEKDRIPALSGLIELFKRSTGDSMVHGLWRADIPHGLIWSASRHDYATDSDAYEPTTLPSWSWIRAHSVSRLATAADEHWARRAASVEVLSLDESNVTITLQGTLFGCPPGPLVNGFDRVMCGSYVVTISHIFWDFLPECIKGCMTNVLPECSSNGAEASAAIWVLVVAEPNLRDRHFGWALMMVREGHPEIYRRVGVARIYFSKGLMVPGWHPGKIHHIRQQPRTQTIKLR